MRCGKFTYHSSLIVDCHACTSPGMCQFAVRAKLLFKFIIDVFNFSANFLLDRDLYFL